MLLLTSLLLLLLLSVVIVAEVVTALHDVLALHAGSFSRNFFQRFDSNQTQ
jgi:hypothetical protein